MKGIAKDICPKCKHCEGLDMFAAYRCKHYNNYPDAAIGMDSEIECCSFEEVNMNKVEGKVGEFCPKCKNCKGTTRESNGVHDWLTEVECEDPYDGMVKTLDADSNVCCSMFEEKKEKEPFNLNMPREAIKAIAKLNDVICELEKEKAAHLKGIERLKKTQEKLQNQVKNLQTTNEESYKREEKLEDKCHKLERKLTEEKKRFDQLYNEFLMPLVHTLYPGEKVFKQYSDILEDIKELKKINTYYDRYKTFTDKIQNLLFQDDHTYEFDEIINKIEFLMGYADENGKLYKELQELRENCHKAETNVTTLNSKVETLKNKNDKYLKKIINQQARDYKQCARIMDLEFAINKLQSGEYDDILAKDIEIKSLQTKYEDAMSGWNHTMELYEKLKNEIDNLNKEKESLTKMVERRDRDVDTLQNAVLEIHNIAQVAYNDIDSD